MTPFETVSLSPDTAADELEALRTLLDTESVLSEREDLLPFFQNHHHLSVALGLFHPESNAPDEIAFEYDFLGTYKADLVVGDSDASAYTLVELENAGPDSIFEDRGRVTSHWSRRFSEGFHQLVDWLYELDQRASDTALRQDFGHAEPDFFTILVIGRSPALSEREWDRLRWYRSRVLVDSTHVFVRTYDELASDLRRSMRLYSAAQE
jgi:hypothetical protein